ncbi:MAG: M28 family metallopeptidase [Thermoguttaceae bacterium]
MAEQGWKRLTTGAAWFRSPGEYPIAAYSEFMPPPRLGRKPYDRPDDPASAEVFDPADPWGWKISAYEEALELQPGLLHVGEELLGVLRHLGRGEAAHGIARYKLRDNPYWPEALDRRGAPPGERYVVLLSLALSRTQDDKGRVRWTLFGASHLGPGRAFWRGFFAAPRRELPAPWGENFLGRLLAAAYEESSTAPADLRRAGLRIYSSPDYAPLPAWAEGPLPSWTAPYRWSPGQSLRGVRYLLSFCPFPRLPAAVQRRYLAGELHLLPFPGSLLFFGAPGYLKLEKELPGAVQIPLLHSLYRHEAPWGLRIPQSGWLHEPAPGVPAPHADFGPLRGTFRRTHRWARVHRHQDELADVSADEDKLAHVLFSAAADDLGLYGKPMARNAQLWTQEHGLLLDGPRAEAAELARAANRLAAGGLFGYRFLYPPMRVGRHEVFWHRPLVAYFAPQSDRPTLLADTPLGFLTAESAEGRRSRPVELWPRLSAEPDHQEAVRLLLGRSEPHYHKAMLNVRKVLETWEMLGRRPLPPSFARQLLTLPKEESLDDWFRGLRERAADPVAAGQLIERLRGCLAERDQLDVLSSRPLTPGPSPEKGEGRLLPPSLTFAHTAQRRFEKNYWRTIALLATGRYVNKDNADCVRDPATQARLAHRQRDLEALGDYLLGYYRRTVEAAGMTGRALVGDLPFRWKTDFHFPWSDGWLKNQDDQTCERDLVVVIPGRDRRRAVVMADHYDTAYMEDLFGYTSGGGGPRLAAAGADDNHSATAALMLAAPLFLDLARQGKLACDIWLVHLTGEEFPSDCMGARHLCQCLVEGTMKIRLADRRWRDLSRTRVAGVYVLDMVAHNNDRDRDVFQICPGTGRPSMWLAQQAHAANRIWNASAPAWNRRRGRRGCGRGRRSADGQTLPATALHPQLHGEVRPPYNPRSTLYNTDGQIFSDAGVPVVLFMENYDINRHGYHDSQDTLANIDLDYGAAVAAIAIESVARAATQTGP